MHERGKAKRMISIKVDDAMARRHLLTLAAAYPRETRRALARYGGLIRRRMAKGVKQKAGVEFSPLREALHPGPAGGPLSNSRSIKIAKPERFAIVVDWIDPLRPFARRWQTGGDTGLRRKEVRHPLHAILGARGMRDIFVDPAETQPERAVSAPIRETARKEAPRMMLGMVRSLLARKG